jgi:hypothetical protein
MERGASNMTVSFIEASHPQHVEESTSELLQLAQNIRAYQDRTSPRLSDEAMVRHFPGLGSTKTYRRLRDGDTSSLVIDTQLQKYRGVWAQIESATGIDGREELYPDLTPTFEVFQAAGGVFSQRGKERFILVEGPTGSGKTSAISVIASRFPGQVFVVEANETWASPMAMTADILVALGIFSEQQARDGELPRSLAERLALIVGRMSSKRLMLAIDEGHHGGAAMLNLIKTLLNKTESWVLLACIDTLWKKLAAKYWEEAMQVIFNRMFERVRLAPPSADDVLMFLPRRVEALKTVAWEKAISTIVASARFHGGFAFLRRMAEHLNKATVELTADVVAKKAAELELTLKTR